MDSNPYCKIQTIEDLDNILNLLVFSCGRYFLLQRYSGPSLLSIFMRGLDKGKRYIQLSIHYNKVNFLSLRTSTINEGDLIFKLRENPDDPLCPYRLFSYYRTIYSPEQERFFSSHQIAGQRKDRLNPKSSSKIEWVTNPRKQIEQNSMSQ